MGKKKWYGVARGKKTGVYDKWFGPGGAHEQINGFKGAVYKGFFSYEEAETFVKSVGEVNRVNSHEYLESDDERLLVYTDGGCINNPGPGGYGAVILYEDSVKELSGGRRHTTNNRMEMMACIKALEYLEKEKREIIVHTDSGYVVNAVNKGWLNSWVRNGWKKSNGTEVLNQDLWEDIVKHLKKLNVKFKWVKGHAGIKYNERCDELANSEARKGSSEIDKGFESGLEN